MSATPEFLIRQPGQDRFDDMNDIAFAVGSRRAAWVPIAVGTLCGVITGIGQALVVGLPESMLWVAALDGSVGLALGATSMVLVLIAAKASQSRARTLAVALPVSAAIAVLAAWLLTRGSLLLPMLAASVITVLAHVIASGRAARHEMPLTSHSVRLRTSRVVVLIGGGLLTSMLSLGAVGMLREQLHYGCSYGTMGEAAGAWMCADGIGYIFPGLTLLFGAGLSLLIGLLVVLGVTRESTIRRVLTILAFAPLLWAVGWLSSVTLPRTDPVPEGETWLGIWLINLGISTMLAVVGATFAASVPAGAGRTTRLLWITSGVFLLAASFVQPGLALATVATGALLAGARLVPLLSQRETTAPSEQRDTLSAG